MPSVETIYRDSILPLPPAERVRLAEMIMKRVSSEGEPLIKSKSALDVLDRFSGKGLFPNAAAVDEYLRAERESWDD